MRRIVFGAALCLSATATLAEGTEPDELVIPPLPTEAYASCAPLDGSVFVGGVLSEDGLPLYSRPRMNATITAVLPSTATGLVRGKCKQRLHNQWCWVTWGCLQGYGRTVFLGENGPSRPMRWAQVIGRPTDSFLMLYSAPDEGSVKAVAISPTARVSVLDCVTDAGGQDWCAVVWGDQTGWALKRYLQF